MSDTPITPSVTDGDTPPATPEAPPAGYVAQSDVDRVVADRLARERAKYKDYDDLKTAAARLAEIEAAQQTDVERATAAAQAAAAELATWKERAQEQTLAATITAVAAKAGAIDPTIVVQLLGKSIEFAEDGTILTDVDATVSEYLTAHPYLVGKAATLTPPAIPGNSQPAPPAGASASQAMATDTNELAKDANKHLLAALIAERNKPGAA